MPRISIEVHPTAVVHESAQIGAGVEIGPYTLIGPHVRVGAGTKISSHVVLEGHTSIGEECRIGKGAVLGGDAQDKKFKGGSPRLEIGRENVIREFVTMHLASSDGAATVVGDRNYFMVGSHVGHDSRVGNDITIANSSALGGFAVVEDKAVIGGLVGVHQHCRIGKMSMVGGCSKVSMDVPPFSLCDGSPLALYGVNAIGLKRAGFGTDKLALLRRAMKLLLKRAAGPAAVEKALAEWSSDPEVRHLIGFIRSSRKGVMRGLVED